MILKRTWFCVLKICDAIQLKFIFSLNVKTNKNKSIKNSASHMFNLTFITFPLEKVISGSKFPQRHADTRYIQKRNVIRYNLRIYTLIFQPRICRKIRIFNLGQRNNIITKNVLAKVVNHNLMYCFPQKCGKIAI